MDREKAIAVFVSKERLSGSVTIPEKGKRVCRERLPRIFVDGSK